MKTSNYLAKLPQGETVKHVQTFPDYDLIALDLPAPRLRICPHCGSINCVIKDFDSWQTACHIPSHHRGTPPLSTNASFTANTIEPLI